MKLTYNQILKRARIKHGVGLRELARAINVSPSYLSRLERGIESRPSDQVILRWALPFGVNIDELFWRLGELTPADKRLLKMYLKETRTFLRGFHALRRDSRKKGG